MSNNADSIFSPTQDDPAEDWHAWVQRSDEAARQRLIEHYMPFAKMLGAKLYARRTMAGAPFDDYRQWAMEGLIHAIDHFDPSRNVPFEAYAAKPIQGTILEHAETLSDHSAQIALRSRLRKERLKAFTDTLTEDACRTLSTDALFKELAEVAVGLALGLMLEDTGMIAADDATAHQPDVYRSVELAQIRERVRILVELLPKQEREVVKYHYFFGYPFNQIADMMQLSKGRISQLHKHALLALRTLQRQTVGLDVRL